MFVTTEGSSITPTSKAIIVESVSPQFRLYSMKRKTHIRFCNVYLVINSMIQCKLLAGQGIMNNMAFVPDCIYRITCIFQTYTLTTPGGSRRMVVRPFLEQGRTPFLTSPHWFCPLVRVAATAITTNTNMFETEKKVQRGLRITT